MKKNILFQRFYTAFFLITITFSFLFFYDGVLFPYMLLVFHSIILWEWVSLHKITHTQKMFSIVLFFSSALILLHGNPSNRLVITLMVFGTFYWLFVVPLIVFKKLPIKNLLAVSSAFIFSLVSFLGLTAAFDIGVVFFFSILCVAWTIDTSGYFFGKKFGKKKLYPSISPNKTWEGVFGGIFMLFLYSITLVFIENTWQFFIYQNFGLMLLLFSNIILLIISIYADLFESLLKRNAGVKDSGSILPGHGGFFDRFDACLAISPSLVLVLLLNQI